LSESNSNSFLTLELDTGPFSFSNIEELHVWLRNEQNAFEWLSALHNVDTSAAQTWRLFSEWFNVVHNFIHDFKSHPGDEGYLTVVSHYVIHLKTET
jgi:hypothetical protein